MLCNPLLDNLLRIIMGDSTPFQKEAWTEYAIGAVVLFLRYFARWRSVGFSKWQGDDVFAVLSLVFWTVSHAPG